MAEGSKSVKRLQSFDEIFPEDSDFSMISVSDSWGGRIRVIRGSSPSSRLRPGPNLPELFFNFKHDRLSQEFDFFSDKQSSLFFKLDTALHFDEFSKEQQEVIVCTEAPEAGAEKCLILPADPPGSSEPLPDTGSSTLAQAPGP